MSSYVPSRLFKFIPPHLMKEVFEKCGVDFPAGNEKARQHSPSALAEAWKAQRMACFGSHNLSKLDAVLQDIHDIGTAKSDIDTILNEMPGHDGSLSARFSGLNNFEKAALFYLHPEYESMWQQLLCTLEVKECSHTSRWHEYSGVMCDLNNLENRKAEIGEAVKDFFWEKKRSEHCRVEIFRKSDCLSYIFAELDDSPEYDEMKHPGDEDFAVCQIVHPFRVVIACDSKAETIGFSAKVPKREVKDFAWELIYAVREKSHNVRPAGCFRYYPSRFLYHSHDLTIERGDGIIGYHITSITVAPWMNKHIRATFTGDRCCNPVEQAQIYMKSSQFNENSFVASDVKMELVVSCACSKKEKVKVSVNDDGCSLINLPDGIRYRVENLFDRWEVRKHA